VASVVLNRVEDERFPNTVCEVVKQPKQFSWYGKKPLTHGNEHKLAERLLKKEVKRNTTALFFTNVRVWLRRRVTEIIGNHRFYE
jgi:N-acetylmuramoyl-L-alanine amidase